jgi:hypothetical protein
MAEDIRHNDPVDGDLTRAKAAVVDECAREEENALYTSTNFFIWLRFLKALRATLWVGAALGSALAASHILRGDPGMKLFMVAAALAGVLLAGHRPGIAPRRCDPRLHRCRWQVQEPAGRISARSTRMVQQVVPRIRGRGAKAVQGHE